MAAEEHAAAIRAIEFFSGIGGLHYALEFAHPNAEVITAYDINSHANACYAHNFKIKPCQTGIQSLTVKSIEKLDANCWLLSPPCQPYTQGGKSLDDKDPRAEGLLHLIKLLGELKQPPAYVFLENVPNFEVSQSRALLVNQLDRLGYEINEFLVTPLQVGISNDRRRYYLTAHLTSSSDPKTAKSRSPYIDQAVIHTTPWPEALFPKRERPPSELPSLASYLEDLADDAPYRKQYDFNDPTSLLDLGLRFFTPTEVARLHGFPIDAIGKGEYLGDVGHTKHGFEFPEGLTLGQRWKLLGNSLNVRVVGVLMRDILFGLKRI
ncbi:C-5 cytosine-specific DNA methylase [Rhizophlyctis rosea]|uniref:tRNA (cytosine(38)-C(5))-methyltransferase n=1 Tax=Rhizophlyctis rosea TaxID=64517 RepID=A0AAD5SGY7_9FUNG|nr:C-5 cytosine-specific DNA methylase [Rhizophlyctis rosea]